MKLFVAVALAGLLWLGYAQAETLTDALSTAYMTNPNLLAERANLRATDENVSQALSGWRPRLDILSTYGRQRVATENVARDQYSSTRQAQVTLTQPLFHSGNIEANIAVSRSQVQGERARLFSQEQNVLMNAATAYFNVVRDRATLDLNINNEKYLSTQLDATRDQFRVGEVTRTDVSQAEARLAGAVADRITAEGNLNTSLANYVQQVGAPAGQLVRAATPDLLLPHTLEESLTVSATDNPDIVAAEFDENSARNQIDSFFAHLLPQVDLVAQYQISRGQSPSSSFFGSGVTFPRIDTASGVVQVTFPLYEQGMVYSQVRQQKQVASQRRIQVDISRRNAIDAAATAFNALVTGRARIASFQVQIDANTVALEGVREEQSVGSRTILDVLNAEQELLNSQVSLVQAQRDELTASYQLLTAIGHLSASNLKLPVAIYDYEANYLHARDQWIGTDLYDDK